MANKTNTTKATVDTTTKKADSKKTGSKKTETIKKSEIHVKVFESLTLFDKLSKESEDNARNTHCDKAMLACNRDDCTIVVRIDSAISRRFFEIWGLSNNRVRVFMSKKEYNAVANKKLDGYIAKYSNEKLSAKYKKPVFDVDYKTAVTILQLMIDNLKAIDEKKEAEAEAK